MIQSSLTENHLWFYSKQIKELKGFVDMDRNMLKNYVCSLQDVSDSIKIKIYQRLIKIQENGHEVSKCQGI